MRLQMRSAWPLPRPVSSWLRRTGAAPPVAPCHLRLRRFKGNPELLGAAPARRRGQSMPPLLPQSTAMQAAATPLRRRRRCAPSAQPAGVTGALHQPPARASPCVDHCTASAPAAGATGGQPHPAQPKPRPLSRRVRPLPPAVCRRWVPSLLRCGSRRATSNQSKPTQPPLRPSAPPVRHLITYPCKLLPSAFLIRPYFAPRSRSVYVNRAASSIKGSGVRRRSKDAA